MTEENDQRLTTKEAGVLVGMSERNMRIKASRGELPSIFGRRSDSRMPGYLIRREDLDAWAKGRGLNEPSRLPEELHDHCCTMREAARVLCLHHQTIERAISEGRIPTYKQGRRKRSLVKLGDVEAWRRSKRQGPARMKPLVVNEGLVAALLAQRRNTAPDAASQP
jgi:excisionase family DNA binding protein